MKRKYNPELEYDPELDFTSEHFNAVKSLKFDIPLPYPRAKKYDNLADWFSHTFGQKSRISQSESKNSSKNDIYILKRNYKWYYDTLGLPLPYNFNEENLRMKEIKRRRDQYGNLKTVNVKAVDPKFLEPLRSSKIIVKKNGFVQKYIRINREDKTDVLYKQCKFQEIKPNISFVESHFSSNKHVNTNKKCEKDSNTSTHCNSVPQTIDCGVTRETRNIFSNINESNMFFSSCDKQKELSQIEANSLTVKTVLPIKKEIFQNACDKQKESSQVETNSLTMKNILPVRKEILQNATISHSSTNLKPSYHQHYFHSSESMKEFLLKNIKNCSNDNFKDLQKLSSKETNYEPRPVVTDSTSENKYSLERTVKNKFDVNSETSINLNETFNFVNDNEVCVDKIKNLSNKNVISFSNNMFSSSVSSSDVTLCSVSDASEKSTNNNEAAKIISNSESATYKYNSGEIIDKKYSEKSINCIDDQSHVTSDKKICTSKEYKEKSTTDKISEGKPSFLQTYKIPKKVVKSTNSNSIYDPIHNHNSLVKNHDKYIQDKQFNKNEEYLNAKRNFKEKTVLKEICNKNDVEKADRNVKIKDTLSSTHDKTARIKINKYDEKISLKRTSVERLAIFESDIKRQNVETNSNSNSQSNLFQKLNSSNKKKDKHIEVESFDDEKLFGTKINLKERHNEKYAKNRKSMKKVDKNCNSSSRTRDSLSYAFCKTNKNFEKLTSKCSSNSLDNLNHEFNSLNKHDENQNKEFDVVIKQSKPYNAKSYSKEKVVLKDSQEYRKDVRQSDKSMNSSLEITGTSYTSRQSHNSSLPERSEKKLNIKTGINLEMVNENSEEKNDVKEIYTIERKEKESKLCDQNDETKYSKAENMKSIKDKEISAPKVSFDSKLNFNSRQIHMMDMTSQGKKEKESTVNSNTVSEDDSETILHLNYNSTNIEASFNSAQDKFLNKNSVDDETTEENLEVSTVQNSTVINQEGKDIKFKRKKSGKVKSNESQRKSCRIKFQSLKKTTLEMENFSKNKNVTSSDYNIEKKSPKSTVCSDSSAERKTNKSPRKLSSTEFLSHKKSTLEIESHSKTKDIKNSDSGIEMNSPKSTVCSDDNSSPERKKVLFSENQNSKFSKYQEKISDVNYKSGRNYSFSKNDEKQTQLKISALNPPLNIKHKLKDPVNEKNSSKKQEKSISLRPSLELSSNFKIKFGEPDKNREYLGISETPVNSRAYFKSTNNFDIDNAKTKLSKIIESKHNEENKPETALRISNSESTSEKIVILDTAVNRKGIKELLCDPSSVLKAVENNDCDASTRKIDLNESYELVTKNISSILNKSSDSIKSTDSDKEMSLLDLARKARNKVRSMTLH